MISVSQNELLPVVDELMSELTLRTYSGRAMYGRDCLAVVGDLSAYTEFVTSVTRTSEYNEALVDFVDALPNVSCDSMGMGTVYYWRGVELTDCEDDEGC